jgi:hypothetical protein
MGAPTWSLEEPAALPSAALYIIKLSAEWTAHKHFILLLFENYYNIKINCSTKNDLPTYMGC